MKYKQRIMTGAIALSLLVGTPSSSVHASSYYPASGITKTSHSTSRSTTSRRPYISRKANHAVGTITGLNTAGFVFDTHAASKALSVDVQIQSDAVFTKDGLPATSADLAVGQKVIVSGPVDTTSQILRATKVNIVTAAFDKKNAKRKHMHV
jgi:hypothetical protein